ncbi:hypothetical protein P7K49_007330 [Saguinus oedipus]|uniref:Uncharacterized protein n=1 Tax=Saguinus oedipus TaxID=9490 RepID=A0ABQ9VW37_SAGOE|nr:hypothetical protein P7K49_007330 [Saguinus oedipus]
MLSSDAVRDQATGPKSSAEISSLEIMEHLKAFDDEINAFLDNMFGPRGMQDPGTPPLDMQDPGRTPLDMQDPGPVPLVRHVGPRTPFMRHAGPRTLSLS